MIFKNGTKIPVIAAAFPKGDLRDLGLGCGYLSVADDEGRVFSWGDNYAVNIHSFLKIILQGQLGTGDDIHRE
jgi:alpha-tubulin suppressor-like RCC1 family protein